MYCKNCGKTIAENSKFCIHCGTQLENIEGQNKSPEGSNFGFAVLGFIIPIVGLILFLVYNKENPKRAKSSGLGALIGFITKIVVSIILIIIFTVNYTSFFQKTFDSITNIQKNEPSFEDVFKEESTNEILKKYLDVSFGKFKNKKNEFINETSLEVTVKNKATKKYSYDIEIEAVDKDGVRIKTDIVYAENLRPGQSMLLTAFEYVDEDMVDRLKNATFRVLEVEKDGF